MNLGNQGGVAGLSEQLHEEFLGKGSIAKEVVEEGSNLLIHHLNKTFGLFAGWNDSKNGSEFFGLMQLSKNREFVLHLKIIKKYHS